MSELMTAPLLTTLHANDRLAVGDSQAVSDPDKFKAITYDALKTQLQSDLNPSGGGVEINVKQAPYNAQGDDTADDVDAINQAIVTANAAGGGTVIAPVGSYKLGAHDDFTGIPADDYHGIRLLSNVTLKGEGDGTVFKVHESVTGQNHTVIYSPSGTVNVRLENCQVDAAKVNSNGGEAFNPKQSSNIRVRGVTFRNSHDDLFDCDGCSDVHVSFCSFYNARACGIHGAGEGFNEIVVANCYFEGCAWSRAISNPASGYATAAIDMWQGKGQVVTACVFKDNARAITCFQNSGAVISGCYMINNLLTTPAHADEPGIAFDEPQLYFKGGISPISDPSDAGQTVVSGCFIQINNSNMFAVRLEDYHLSTGKAYGNVLMSGCNIVAALGSGVHNKFSHALQMKGCRIFANVRAYEEEAEALHVNYQDATDVTYHFSRPDNENGVEPTPGEAASPGEGNTAFIYFNTTTNRSDVVRGNNTTGVPPTEVSSPVLDDTVYVVLANQTMEFWHYNGSSWDQKLYQQEYWTYVSGSWGLTFSVPFGHRTGRTGPVDLSGCTIAKGEIIGRVANGIVNGCTFTQDSGSAEHIDLRAPGADDWQILNNTKIGAGNFINVGFGANNVVVKNNVAPGGDFVGVPYNGTWEGNDLNDLVWNSTSANLNRFTRNHVRGSCTVSSPEKQVWENNTGPGFDHSFTEATTEAGNIRTKYGAKGDGVTNDLSAFTSALADSTILYLPAGTYRIFGDLPIPTGTRIVGVNAGLVTIRQDDPTKSVLNLAANAGVCSLENVTLEGTGAASHDAPGIDGRLDAGGTFWGSDITFTNVVVKNIRTGIDMAGVSNWTTRNFRITGTRVGAILQHIQTSSHYGMKINVGDNHADSAVFDMRGGNFLGATQIHGGEFGGSGYKRFMIGTAGIIEFYGANVEGISGADGNLVQWTTTTSDVRRIGFVGCRLAATFTAATQALISVEVNVAVGLPEILFVNSDGDWTGTPRQLELYGVPRVGPRRLQGAIEVNMLQESTSGNSNPSLAGEVVTQKTLQRGDASMVAFDTALPASGMPAEPGAAVVLEEAGQLAPDKWCTNHLRRVNNHHTGNDEWKSIINAMFGEVQFYNNEVGNASSTETDLSLGTLKAKSLAANGDSALHHVYGTFAANGNNKTFKVYFGATLIATIPTGTWNGESFDIRVTWGYGPWAGSGGSIKYSVVFLTTTTRSVLCGEVNLNNNADVDIKVTGTGVATDDIRMMAGKCISFRSGPTL